MRTGPPIVATLALLLSLGAALPSSAEVAEPALFAEQPGTRGFLFEVRSDRTGADSHLFLYGTIHVGTAAQSPFTHAVKASLAQSQRLALEADVSDLGSAVGQLFALGMYPAGDSLEQHLPAALHARLIRAFARSSTPMAQLERMRLFGVPMLLEVLEAQRAGLQSEHGADVYLAAYAKHHRMPIVEIEGFALQFKLMASLPEAVQLAQVKETLDALDSGEAGRKMRELIDCWTQGRSAKMEALIRELHTTKQVGERAFTRLMLDERNLAMAQRAVAMLKEPGTTFFAVGAAHLFGEHGLVAELKRRGHAVKALR